MSQLGSIRIGPPPPTRRGFSIRAKVVTLLVAPLVPLLIMTTFTLSIANGPARNLADARTTVDTVGYPVTIVVGQLQAERTLSVRYVGDKSHNAQVASQLATTRQAADAAIGALAKSTSSKTFTDAASNATKSLLAKVTTTFGDLPTGRKAIDDGESRFAVMTFYNGIIDNMFRLYRSIESLDDHVLAGRADTVVAISQSGEMWTREDALVIGALTAGAMSNRDYSEITGAIALQRQMYAAATAGLSATNLATYKQLTSTPKARSLKAMEDSVVAHPDLIGAPLKIDPAAWQDDFNATFASIQAFDDQLAQQAINDTVSASASRATRLWLVTIACALMLLVLVFFSWRIARNLLRRVARLRAEALTLALDRLPSVVERIRTGQSVDVATEAPPLAVGADELGQLSEAFTRVQHVAISSAVHEATLREGFNQVFLNIARRSQTLLHRQLALLDAMERRVTDPEELEELFRVDHLATRMRRHAEDLVILAGSTPGRGWRSPVAVADVLRAAASEVEEYARINVVVPPNLAVVGRAVNDIVHLLAELLENATLFSPPESQVTLSAQLVPNGFAIEVEDRGLGMAPEAIDDANERLANPPDFDPQHSSRLGLFVVAKLAERQGIQVALRRSPYGGITAVALIPSELVVAPGSSRPDTIEGDVVPNPISSRPPVASRIMALSGAPQRAEATDWPQPPEPRDEAAARTADGLPMRIRQASVARALPESTDETMEVPVTAPSRSPEEMRSMLASFQSGMTKGRKAAAGEVAGEALAGSTQNHSDKLSVANGHAPEREPHDVMAESDVVAPKTVTDEAIDASTPAPAEPSDYAVTPVASGERTAEPGDLPPLPQRVGRHGHAEAAPVTGTGDMATRSTETLSTAEDSQPSAPRGGGNDDN